MPRHVAWLLGLLVLSATAGEPDGQAPDNAAQPDQTAPALFSGSGSGTRDDPYRIASPQQLLEVARALDAHYVLVASIDLSDVSGGDEGPGFRPLGSRQRRPFSGTFDGQGHTITGLRIRLADRTEDTGLFGCVDKGGVIRNLCISNACVQGVDYVGILVGINFGWVHHCRTSGTIQGAGSFGGLAGANWGGTVTCCQSAADVRGGNHLGGLIGMNESGTVEDSFATGSVTGEENPAGLAGCNRGGTITRCYATGPVASSFLGFTPEYRRAAGGLVASNQGGYINTRGGTIRHCLATGSVSGPEGLPVGRLVGLCDGGATVSDSFFFLPPGSAAEGIGLMCAAAGSADCAPVAEINARFFHRKFDAGAGWDFQRIWMLDPDASSPSLPLLR